MISPQQFVAKWRGVELKERSAAQEHFLDLCAVLGQPTPAEAARELVRQRDAWLNPPGASEKELKKRTLTNLYNQRPTWLDLAHRRLDAAVFAAYGWPADLGDEQVLERLLVLNLERAGAARQ